MKIFFSTSHAFAYSHDFIARTIEHLNSYDYAGLELCHEGHEQKNGLPFDGGIDDWIKYSVLVKLNEHKQYKPQDVLSMRELFGSLKKRNKEIIVWSHELWTPYNILEIYPELATPRGDINLAHPLMTEFLRDKYSQFFKAVPEVDTIMLTLAEVSYSVLARFDNEWNSSQCLEWLLQTVYTSCKEYGKKLVVRPFSPNAEDYAITRQVLQKMPDDVEVMLKTDPFDWNPFLPINPELAKFPPEKLRAEFSISGEYYGGSLEFPVLTAEYFRKRIEHAKNLGIDKVVARIDRDGRSAFNNANSFNIDIFCELCSNQSLDVQKFLSQKLAEKSQTSQPQKLAELLLKIFDVSVHVNYVDGNLTFHAPFGTLEYAQRFMLFYLFCPCHNLGHCDLEWAIIQGKTTPTREAILNERREALQNLRELTDEIRKVAPNDSLLIDGMEKFCDFAKLYLILAGTILNYIRAVETQQHENEFDASCKELSAFARQLLAKYGRNWLCDTPVRAQTFINELSLAFQLEKTIRKTLPSLAEEQKKRLDDFIPAGYPGEAHRLRKNTHGSFARLTEKKCYREAETFFEYTLAPKTPGAKTLLLECIGTGKIELSQNGKPICVHEINSPDWQKLTLEFQCDAAPMTLRVQRLGSRRPALHMTYLLSS